MRMILVVLAALSFQQVAHAQTTGEDAALQAALYARNEYVTAVQNQNFNTIAHDVLDAVIRDFANQLSTTDSALATDLLNQWNQSSATFSESVASVIATPRALGDHPPLFPWLANFIQTLESRYPQFASIQIVQDIWTMNYAIPVVFTPHGSWEAAGANNEVEYSLHFIPFSDIVTYYASEYACKLALKHYGLTDLKQLCPKAGSLLEWVTNRYIAPPASNWIFSEANGASQSAMVITNQQLYYQTVSDLKTAIQQQ